MVKEPGLFALIGAGPSLDYCEHEISDLIIRGAHFFVSDSVAAGFLRRWRPSLASVFTVESRRHFYLVRIDSSIEFSLLAYRGANSRNLRVPDSCIVSQFQIQGESGSLPMLYSPGTVLGVMLSCATELSIGRPDREIHIFGADFCYLENQVYCRLIDHHAPQGNRLLTREQWQYDLALKKSSEVWLRGGYAIRTSFEFARTRENLRAYIELQPEIIRYIEYSPLGLETARAEKRIPRNS